MSRLQGDAPEPSAAEAQISPSDEGDVCLTNSLVGRIVKTLRGICGSRVKPIESDLSLTSSMHRLRAIEQFRQKAISVRKQTPLK